MPAEVYGHFVGAFGRQISNYRVPILTMKLDPAIDKMLTGGLKFGSGVAALESMLDGKDITLKFSLPSEVCMFLPPVIEDMECVALWHELHKSGIRQILDSIRSQLLEIVLDLAERFPEITESEKAVENVDRKEAASIINNHIYGNSNVVAAGAHIKQSLRQNFGPHDVDAMMMALDGIGLSEKERGELRSAIKDDGKPKEGKFGTRVAKWIGNTTQKLLETGMTAAPAIITEAVQRYYGWK